MGLEEIAVVAEANEHTPIPKIGFCFVATYTRQSVVVTNNSQRRIGMAIYR